MNRIYHARVTFCRGLVLICLSVATLLSLWWRWPLAALPAMLLLLWWIERLIHTTYTLTTDQRLLIDKGRFSQKSAIRLTDICHSQRLRTVPMAYFIRREGIKVTCHDGTRLTLFPQREEEFLQDLQRRCSLFTHQQPSETNIDRNHDESNE